MRTGPTGAVLLMAQTLVSPVPPPGGAPPHQSACHSPNSYLYGLIFLSLYGSLAAMFGLIFLSLYGSLAAMFGLIFLFLVMLACSHFGNSNSRDEEGGSHKSVTNRRHHRVPYVEQFVVIMAGEANPSFLATPISIRPATSDPVNNDKNGEQNSEKTDGATAGDETEPH